MDVYVLDTSDSYPYDTYTKENLTTSMKTVDITGGGQDLFGRGTNLSYRTWNQLLLNGGKVL